MKRAADSLPAVSRLGWAVTDDPPYSGPDTQLRLPLQREPSFDRASFVVSERNREAVDAMDDWRKWPGGCLVLVGPEGCGKTHLARAWAAATEAAIISRGMMSQSGGVPPGPVLLEDADRVEGGEALFNLINRAVAGDALLLTARAPPRSWKTTLPDLKSRLNALYTVDMAPPDDDVLEGVLRNLFRDRHIRPDPDLLAYLLRRMERSAPAAAELVDRLDLAADAARRSINRALAREILELGERTGDLFP